MELSCRVHAVVAVCKKCFAAHHERLLRDRWYLAVWDTFCLAATAADVSRARGKMMPDAGTHDMAAE